MKLHQFVGGMTRPWTMALSKAPFSARSVATPGESGAAPPAVSEVQPRSGGLRSRRLEMERVNRQLTHKHLFQLCLFFSGCQAQHHTTRAF